MLRAGEILNKPVQPPSAELFTGTAGLKNHGVTSLAAGNCQRKNCLENRQIGLVYFFREAESRSESKN
jgi:hypothetical protein